MHEARDVDIKKISETTQRHAGQWKVFLWGISLIGGSTIAIIVTLLSFQYKSMNASHAIMTQLDKTFTAYMSAHSQESMDGFRRISSLEDRVTKNTALIMKNSYDIKEQE